MPGEKLTNKTEGERPQNGYKNQKTHATAPDVDTGIDRSGTLLRTYWPCTPATETPYAISNRE
jgi:hypothetical protein